MKGSVWVVTVVVTLVLMSSVASGVPVSSYTPSAYWGNGAFRTYLTQDSAVPVSVGYEFSAAFFHDTPPLSQTMPDMPGMAGMAMGKMVLPLVDEVPVYTPFQSFEIEYSSGHPYPYNTSHFDVYWFFQNADYRESNITASTKKTNCSGLTPDAWCRANVSFTKACCPPAYGNIGLTFATIGGSLNDFLATERLPPTDPKWTPFQMSLGFVIYMGRITGYRVMTSWNFYQTLVNGAPKKCNFFRLPTESPDPGYYPAQVCSYLTPSGNLRTELTGFKNYPTAGCKAPIVPGTCAYIPKTTLPPQCTCSY